MTRVLAVLLSLAFLVAAPAASARSTEMVPPHAVTLTGPAGAPLDAAATREAILAGAAAKGWTMQSEAPGRIELSVLVRGKHTVVVAAVYTPGEVRFDYVSSIEMNHKVRKDGSVRIHPNYMAWRGFLEQAVREAAAKG